MKQVAMIGQVGPVPQAAPPVAGLGEWVAMPLTFGTAIVAIIVLWRAVLEPAWTKWQAQETDRAKNDAVEAQHDRGLREIELQAEVKKAETQAAAMTQMGVAVSGLKEIAMVLQGSVTAAHSTAESMAQTVRTMQLQIETKQKLLERLERALKDDGAEGKAAA